MVILDVCLSDDNQSQPFYLICDVVLYDEIWCWPFWWNLISPFWWYAMSTFYMIHTQNIGHFYHMMSDFLMIHDVVIFDDTQYQPFWWYTWCQSFWWYMISRFWLYFFDDMQNQPFWWYTSRFFMKRDVGFFNETCCLTLDDTQCQHFLLYTMSTFSICDSDHFDETRYQPFLWYLTFPILMIRDNNNFNDIYIYCLIFDIGHSRDAKNHPF